MHLFSHEETSLKNLLPNDGRVHYYSKIFSTTEAGSYFAALLQNIQWKNDESFIYGKLITTKRKAAWYADDNFAYKYSGTTKKALPFTNELLAIKKIVEEKTGEHYNSCLLNLYHNGNEGMGWHSDAEKELKKNGAIASVSFGAETKFLFRHKQSKETIEVQLENGSLLLMKGETQTHWLHRLPATKKIYTGRINLTFRTVIV
ncbi:MAG: alpha-ketoglutarate-dependent dioxygenase AlkB [Ferruginibacter sp.]|nr:alpha-ketoglutarate-dependent dioxygenase AlkB [Ferruginibacter sp.]